LFLTGARVSEFVHLRVEDLFLDDEPPQIHITNAKGNTDRYVPVLPALAQELHTYLENRRRGRLFKSNRQQRYAVRSVQAMVRRCALRVGIGKRVYLCQKPYAQALETASSSPPTPFRVGAWLSFSG
jgi:integrase/recombinase XerD